MRRGIRILTALKRPRLLEDNAPALLVLTTYLLVLLSRLIDTALLDRTNEHLGVALLQIFIFLFPALVYARLNRGLTFSRIRMRLPRPSHILLLVWATLALISGCLLISVYTGGIRTDSEHFSLYNTFLARSGHTAADVIQLMITYAVLPAVCEELVFRGLLCASLERAHGLVATVLCSAVYFGMLHLRLDQLPVYMFAGVLLCMVMYATRSLIAAMIVHFAYNLFGLFGQSTVSGFYLYTGSTELFTFLLTCILLASSLLFCGEAGRVYRIYAGAVGEGEEHTVIPPDALPSHILKALLPPAGIACIVLYILVCLFF